MGTLFRAASVILVLASVTGAAAAQARQGELPPGAKPISMEAFREIQEQELRKRQIQKLDEEIATQKAAREAEEARTAAVRAETERRKIAPVASVPAAAVEGPPLTGALLILATLGGTVLGFILGRMSRKAAAPH